MEEKEVPIAVDPWAGSFERLLEILQPLGASRDNVADHYFIKKNMYRFKDLLTPDQLEEVSSLVKHVHK